MNKNYVQLETDLKFFTHFKDSPLAWAMKNCLSYITVNSIVIDEIFYYRFYFSDEKDLINFSLKWL